MILLDTCTLLWLTLDQTGLSERAKALLRANPGSLYVSPITAFEIGQKYARGKLELSLPPDTWFELALHLHGLKEARLDSQILLMATRLPDLHRDPFDRILMATSRILKQTLLTPDPHIRAYPEIQTEW